MNLRFVFLIIAFLLTVPSLAFSSHLPPSENPHWNPSLHYICYWHSTTGNDISIIFVKADQDYVVANFNSGIVDFYPSYGPKIGRTMNGDGISHGGSYDWYMYSNGSWTLFHPSTFYLVNNSISLDSQIACSTNLYASYPGFAFQGKYYRYPSVIMPANYSGLPVSYQLAVNLSPQSSGTVTGAGISCDGTILTDCSENYTQGQSVTLMATANSGYEFADWLENGQIITNGCPATTLVTTMNSARTITAQFVQVMSVNVSVNSAMGSVVSSEEPPKIDTESNATSTTYHFNDPVTLTANSKPGYRFVRWEENGQTVTTDKTLAFNVQEAKCLTAVFEPFVMKLPLPGGKHWVLSVEAGGEVQCGGGIDPYHTGNSYYALDFVDYTSEDGHLEGTDVPILATAAGTVAFAGDDGSWGNTVVLDHGNGYKTRYAHLKYVPTVSGAVTQGQQIGIMGDTPGSMGIHLHFQVYHGDNDSSSTNEFVKAVYLEELKLDEYQVDVMNCAGAAYLSTNQQ
jgi:murein DD-endopeptidase MepM/ murein hydrolase activator NlpD